jgi:transcriptional regulator with XRE-family HTH domain
MSVGLQHRRLLGEAVRLFRKRAGWSQEKLAERAGLSAIFISRVERGIESPTVDSLVKIAHALDRKVRELVASF